MESIKVKSLSGIGKAVGVTLCLAGVAAIAFYRGPRIHPLNLHGHFAHSAGRRDHAPANTPKATWIEGTFFVIGANLTWSLWLVYQVLTDTRELLAVEDWECAVPTTSFLTGDFAEGIPLQASVNHASVPPQHGSVAFCGHGVRARELQVEAALGHGPTCHSLLCNCNSRLSHLFT